MWFGQNIYLPYVHIYVKKVTLGKSAVTLAELCVVLHWLHVGLEVVYVKYFKHVEYVPQKSANWENNENILRSTASRFTRWTLIRLYERFQ